ncbi:MAG: carbohydrate ABC transporter substrate-binding protein [Defluviitaleaceae bacterium]|nr:carbohydrate ABC transporter substrate-binding protein [Defluviitaleaceae bacterium]MCL2262571.1 carbohydrate ABC transporter substrate-binding protein [Defluviitaleaceae bacterium]
MKRKLIFLLVLVAMLAFAACGTNEPAPAPAPQETVAENGAPAQQDATEDPVEVDVVDETPRPEPAEGQTVINLWSFTDELPNMVARYKELNPEFAERYLVVPTVVATDGGQYQLALDMALQNGDVDFFAAEAAFVVRYTQGDMSQFAMPLSELGIENLMGRIAEAQIAPYIVELGTRQGEVVGLAFQHTGGAVIYRRSLAEQVWGTDDPDYVRTRIGPGWDRFFEAAAEMDAEGIAMVSGAGDIWQAVRNTGGPWIVNNRINIHPDRMAFFDYAYMLYQNGWMNDAAAWQGAWFADMQGVGERPVFAFLGPAWLINHVMVGNVGDTYGDWAIAVPPVGFNWGGTWVIPAAQMNPDASEGVRELLEWILLDTSDTGLQHHWAGGTLFPGNETKDAVASGVVMAGADGTVDILGGQDMFDIFIPAGAYADGTLFTQHDEQINLWFIDDAVMHYARGDMTREEALDAFMLLVYENLGIN